MKFGRKAVVLFSFGLLLFLSLMYLVLFQRDRLDDLFYGSLPEESKEYLAKVEKDVDDVSDIMVGLESVDLLVSVEDKNKASVFLDLSTESSLAGFDLYFKKDASLEITDFVCEPPFECIFVQLDDEEIMISAIIPIVLTGSVHSGQVLVGEFSYTGSGTLYFRPNEESFIASAENPGLNLLIMGEGKEFLFGSY